MAAYEALRSAAHEAGPLDVKTRAIAESHALDNANTPEDFQTFRP